MADSPEGVAHAIRIEHKTERAFVPIRRDGVFWADGDGVKRGSPREFRRSRRGRKGRPKSRAFAGENDVAGFGILADEDFTRGEAEIRGQTDGLAAAVLEKLGNFAHGSPPRGFRGRPA